MVMYMALEAGTLDPHQETSVHSLTVLAPAYGTLMQFDPNEPTAEKIALDLAERWETSRDGLTWTFSLRKGVKFHDGQPLTAADVKFSFERIMNPPAGVVSPWRSLWAGVKSVEAVDPSTVRVTLSQPKPLFAKLATWYYSAIVPKHVLEKDPRAVAAKPVGSGPWVFKEWRKGVSLEYAKNRDYYRPGRPYMDGLKFLIIRDPTTAFAALRTRQVTISGPGTAGPTKSMVETLKRQEPRMQVWQYDASAVFLLVFNVQKKPWDDVRVRRAVALVLDAQKIIDVAFDGVGRKSGFMGWGEWSLPDAELQEKWPPYRGPTEKDIEAAKKLLAEAGHPGGFKTTFNQMTLPRSEEEQVIITSQLRKIGIDSTVRVLVYPADFLAAARRGDFEMASAAFVTVVDDPDVYFVYYTTGNPENWGKFSDKQVDDLYARQSREMDPVKRKELAFQLQRRLMELVPAVVTRYPQWLGAAWPELRGYKGPGKMYNNLKWEDVWLAR